MFSSNKATEQVRICKRKLCLFAVKCFVDRGIKLDRAERLSLSLVNVIKYGIQQ